MIDTPREGSLSKGWWQEGVFHFPIRVYYEDTDLGGMVYHGRYISFFERVRTESIRDTGCDVDVLAARPKAEGGSLVYVVRSINVTYHRQAKLGDILIGHTMAQKLRAAALEAKQWITRDGDLIAEADVLIALVDQKGRPSRWPASAKDAWTQMIEGVQKGTIDG